MTKKWYESKTKVGTVIFGVGTVITSVGSYMMGSISATIALEGAIAGVASIFIGIGIRNALD